jgi:hypothetical protein
MVLARCNGSKGAMKRLLVQARVQGSGEGKYV